MRFFREVFTGMLKWGEYLFRIRSTGLSNSVGGVDYSEVGQALARRAVQGDDVESDGKLAMLAFSENDETRDAAIAALEADKLQNAHSEWRSSVARKKAQVGMARRGTIQYNRNAAHVLAVHAGPGMRPETRAKLQALAQSRDPETRAVARSALGQY